MTTPHQDSSVNGHGKFFSRAGKKFFLKAMRLEVANELPGFEQKLQLRVRLDQLRDARTTGLVVSHTRAADVLDLAEQAGLTVLVEIAVSPTEMITSAGYRAIASEVTRTASSMRNHPAVAGYIVDCPAGADWLRMQGLPRVQRRLGRLLEVIRRSDPNRLVAIHHRPATRGLILHTEDFIYSSVPPLTLGELKSYVVNLHDVADVRPVVVEFDQSTPEQDDLVGCAFALGAAGVVAPPIQRNATPDQLQLRAITAGEVLPFLTLNGTCPPALREAPMVSVVICAYNAERTMRACMESLATLEYPNFEVIVVDDGSRDRTAEIAKDYPKARLIRQPNKGLSVARNVGLYAARGEYVAYTDSDCVVDPHWLTLMIGAMVENKFEACGGPNYAPHEAGRTEACVAVSPGAPCQVLTASDRAEHLAGCNMVFRKSLLIKLGGFDPQFTAAGDDVDICWRTLDSGATLGFCPSAFVWHFRRNTIKAYYGQQRGYGKAEALLFFKYPERFNSLGQIKWRGTIPGLARTIPGGGRKRVFWGGSRAFFQTVYEPRQGLLKFLPQTLEWVLFWVGLAIVAGLARLAIWPALAMLMLGPVWALHYAFAAPLEKCHRSLRSRLQVALLAYTGPMVRTMTRYRLRLAGAWNARLADEPEPRQRPKISLLDRSVKLAYWNEVWTTRESLIDRVAKLFARAGHAMVFDGGWNDYDLEVRPDVWTRIELKTADEEHPGGKLKNHVMARIRLSRLTQRVLIAGAAGAIVTALFGMSVASLVLAGLTLMAAAFALSEAVEAGRMAYRAIESGASELNLTPLGVPIAATHRVEDVPVQRLEEEPVLIVNNPPPATRSRTQLDA